jgi:hypothetical protein
VSDDPLTPARGIVLGVGLGLAGWAAGVALAYLTAWLVR